MNLKLINFIINIKIEEINYQLLKKMRIIHIIIESIFIFYYYKY